MLDELERIRAYRDEVPEPDAAVVKAARAELLEAIAQAPQSTGRDRHASRDRHGRADGRTSRWRAPRRRLAVATVLTAVAAVVAVAVSLHTAAAPPSALAQQLDQLARVAAGQAWTGIPKRGQYLYTESVGLTESGTDTRQYPCTINLTDHRQIWIATDGSGAIAEIDNHARLAPAYMPDGKRITDAQDRANCARQHISPASQNGSSANTYPKGRLSAPAWPRHWRTLSTDPTTLLRQAHKLDGGPDTPAEWFVNVGDMLRESDAPPAIRAALYRAVALIPHVQLLGMRTDPAGQTGLAVDFPYPSGKPQSVLIFDQRTAKLLGEEEYGSDGALTDWTAYLQSKIVSKLPHYPLSRD